MKTNMPNQELPEKCDTCSNEELKDERMMSNISIEAFEAVKIKPGSFQSGQGLFKKKFVISLGPF